MSIPFDPDDRNLTFSEGIDKLLSSYQKPCYGEDGRILLDGFDHKKLLISLFYLHPDHRWSYNEYIDGIKDMMIENIIKGMVDKGYLATIRKNGNMAVCITDEGDVAYENGQMTEEEIRVIQMMEENMVTIDDDDDIEEVDPDEFWS